MNWKDKAVLVILSVAVVLMGFYIVSFHTIWIPRTEKDIQAIAQVVDLTYAEWRELDKADSIITAHRNNLKAITHIKGKAYIRYGNYEGLCIFDEFVALDLWENRDAYRRILYIVHGQIWKDTTGYPRKVRVR